MGKLHSKHGKVSHPAEKIPAARPVSPAVLSSNTSHCLVSLSQAAICKPRESPEGKRTYSLCLVDEEMTPI